MNDDIKFIENESKEYFSVYIDDNKICLHIGYYEALLNNKQIDELIKVLKYYKTHK